MVRVDNTRKFLAEMYSSLGDFLGLATADPGTTQTPANEASGGSYARVATSWSYGDIGWATGTPCTISANAATYTFAILCHLATGPNMFDNCVIDSTTLSSAGQIVLTPSYVQT